MRKFLPGLLLLVLTAVPGAQELNITQTTAPQTAPFAQPFALQYHLAHTPGYQVALDENSLSKDFAITNTQVSQNSPGTITYDFTVVPFTLGKSTFTASFQLVQEDNVLLEQPSSVPVEITPVKVFKDKKFREIRPPFISKWWIKWLLLLLIVLAILYMLYWWKKHLNAKKQLHVANQEDTRPSHVIALSKIDALLQSGLWENSQYKLFYVSLIDILREYLHRRFGLDVSAETSAELLAHIKTKQELINFVTALRELLSASDLIKFAKAVPTEQQRNGHILILREFIEQNIPAEQPVSEVKK